jgi:Holliday junction resolvasome RuvABC DNA-binding subunit
MTRKERNDFVKWTKGLSDAELKDTYYDTVYCYSLGSQTEAMYELGYDMQDIKEQEAFEKFLHEKSDILENECLKRNIKLWEK